MSARYSAVDAGDVEAAGRSIELQVEFERTDNGWFLTNDILNLRALPSTANTATAVH
jgi:hypothetical protein